MSDLTREMGVSCDFYLLHMRRRGVEISTIPAFIYASSGYDQPIGNNGWSGGEVSNCFDN
jgi:hypothetical protein